MKIKRTKTHFVVQFTRKEFDAFGAALDSIADATSEGAYMDVVRLYEDLCQITANLSQVENNIWVSKKKK